MDQVQTITTTTYCRKPFPLISIFYRPYMPESTTVSINGKRVIMDICTFNKVKDKLMWGNPQEAKAIVLRHYRKWLQKPALRTYGYPIIDTEEVVYIKGNSSSPENIQEKLRAYKLVKEAYPTLRQKYAVTTTTGTLGADFRPEKIVSKRTVTLAPTPVCINLLPPSIFDSRLNSR